MVDPEKRLRYLVSLIGPVLLPGWNIELHIHHQPLPLAQRDEAAGFKCIALCQAKWEYCEANLHFNLQAFSELARVVQTEFVIHELLHGAVNEMRTRGKNHEERVVSTLTGAFMRALQTPAIRKELR